MQVLEAGWVKHGNIFVYPHQWQRPAKTEEWIFEELLKKNINSNFVEFVSFPWATLIDLILRKKNDRAGILINVLRHLPPRKALFRISACQHINIEIINEFLYELNFTDLFWAHKRLGVDSVNKVRLHPLALYPYAFYEMDTPQWENKKRKYAYSFMGAYDKNCYISDVRRKIFNLECSSNVKIVKRDRWHFESEVYDHQINEKKLSIEQVSEMKIHTNEYSNLLLESTYSICPSGAGVNSIRLWESFAYGCIPIIFSPDYDFPKLNIKLKYINSHQDINSFEFNALDLNVRQNMAYSPINSLENLFDFFSIANLVELKSK